MPPSGFPLSPPGLHSRPREAGWRGGPSQGPRLGSDSAGFSSRPPHLLAGSLGTGPCVSGSCCCPVCKRGMSTPTAACGRWSWKWENGGVHQTLSAVVQRLKRRHLLSLGHRAVSLGLTNAVRRAALQGVALPCLSLLPPPSSLPPCPPDNRQRYRLKISQNHHCGLSQACPQGPLGSPQTAGHSSSREFSRACQ